MSRSEVSFAILCVLLAIGPVTLIAYLIAVAWKHPKKEILGRVALGCGLPALLGAALFFLLIYLAGRAVTAVPAG